MPLLSGVRRHSILSRLTNAEGYPGHSVQSLLVRPLTSARDCTPNGKVELKTVTLAGMPSRNVVCHHVTLYAIM